MAEAPGARVDDVAFERCVALLRTRQYRRGDTIFHQGDLGDSLHVIESGSVKIVLPSPEGEEEAIIGTLGPGDFFGELSLLDGEERSATAIAQEATVTSILRRDVFESLLGVEIYEKDDPHPDMRELARQRGHRLGRKAAGEGPAKSAP